MIALLLLTLQGPPSPVCRDFAVPNPGQTTVCVWDGGKDITVSQPFPSAAPLTDSSPITVGLAERMGDHAWWLGLGTTFDLLGTAAFEKWCANCHESNPLIFTPAAAVPIKLASFMLSFGSIWRAEKLSQHRKALVYRWMGFTFQAVAGGWDTYLAIRGAHPAPAAARRR